MSRTYSSSIGLGAWKIAKNKCNPTGDQRSIMKKNGLIGHVCNMSIYMVSPFIIVPNNDLERESLKMSENEAEQKHS